MYENLIEEKVSSEDIFDGVLLHVKRDYVKLPNGNKAVREWIKHQGASMITTKASGVFMENDNQARKEFFDSLKINNGGHQI